jgi:hypothetical protein
MFSVYFVMNFESSGTAMSISKQACSSLSRSAVSGWFDSVFDLQ